MKKNIFVHLFLKDLQSIALKYKSCHEKAFLKIGVFNKYAKPVQMSVKVSIFSKDASANGQQLYLE